MLPVSVMCGFWCTLVHVYKFGSCVLSDDLSGAYIGIFVPDTGGPTSDIRRVSASSRLANGGECYAG